MNKSETAFLELLTAGLWGREVREEILRDSDVDWERVVELARQQTVVGIVGEAMSQLPRGVMPRPLYLQMLKEVMEIEEENKRMNTLVPVLFRTLDQLGVQSWLLKGQGVAQCYENPLRRTSGDIDVFFPLNGEYEKAREDFLTHLKLEDVHNDNHQTKTLEFEYKGIYIELHGRILPEVNRRCNRHFATFQKECQGERGIEWNGAMLPPMRFDAVFIFMHMVRHYFGGGIGLRQVSDWMRYVHKHRQDIREEKLKKDLQKTGLFKLWQAFGCMAVECLGCPSESMFFYSPSFSKQARRLLKYILESGNFGYYDERTKSDSRFYFVRRFVAFWGHLQMKLRNLMMFPEESVYGIPSFIVDGLMRTKAQIDNEKLKMDNC